MATGRGERYSESDMDVSKLKLEIFIPKSHFPKLRLALQSVGAGKIGNYDSCLAYSRVTGSWRPLQGSQPYIGVHGEISEAPELKVEVNIRKDALQETLKAIREVHPYEQPVINVIPLYM